MCFSLLSVMYLSGLKGRASCLSPLPPTLASGIKPKKPRKPRKSNRLNLAAEEHQTVELTVEWWYHLISGDIRWLLRVVLYRGVVYNMWQYPCICIRTSIDRKKSGQIVNLIDKFRVSSQFFSLFFFIPIILLRVCNPTDILSLNPENTEQGFLTPSCFTFLYCFHLHLH